MGHGSVLVARCVETNRRSRRKISQISFTVTIRNFVIVVPSVERRVTHLVNVITQRRVHTSTDVVPSPCAEFSNPSCWQRISRRYSQDRLYDTSLDRPTWPIQMLVNTGHP